MQKPIKCSKFNRKVLIEVASHTQNGIGGTVKEWKPLQSLWAFIECHGVYCLAARHSKPQKDSYMVAFRHTGTISEILRNVVEPKLQNIRFKHDTITLVPCSMNFTEDEKYLTFDAFEM